MVKIVGSFEVDDWVHWKKTFDAHSEAREKANIKSIYVGNELAVSYTHLRAHET